MIVQAHVHTRSNGLCEPQYVCVYVDIMSDTEIAIAAIIIVCLTEKKNEKESREYLSAIKNTIILLIDTY